MNKRVSQILRYLLFLFIGLGLLWWAYRDTEFSEITSSLSKAKWGWIIVSLLLSYASMALRGIRWNILLQPMGHRADTWTSIHTIAFGYLMNDLVPRSGELARCGLLSRAEKIPVDKLFGTVILERLVDIIILVLLILVVVLMRGDAVNSLFAQVDGGRGFAILLLGLAGIGGLIVIYLLLRAFSTRPWAQRIIFFLRGMKNGFISVLHIRHKFRFIIFSLGIWLIWLLMTQTMMFALEETELVTAGDSLFLMVAAGIGMLIPAPGGIGAYHFATMKGFEALGYATSAGLTFAAISWTAKTILEIIAGGTGFIAVTMFKIKKDRNGFAEQ